MNKKSDSQQHDDSTEFERLGEQQQPMLLIEFWHFLKAQKKWWLAPLLVALAVYATFLIVSISSGPTFIYKLF